MPQSKKKATAKTATPESSGARKSPVTRSAKRGTVSPPGKSSVALKKTGSKKTPDHQTAIKKTLKKKVATKKKVNKKAASKKLGSKKASVNPSASEASKKIPAEKVEARPTIKKPEPRVPPKPKTGKQESVLPDSSSQGLAKPGQKKRGWRDIEALTERARLKSLLSDIWHEDIDLDTDIFGEKDHLFGYYTDKEEAVEVEPEEDEEWEEFEEEED